MHIQTFDSAVAVAEAAARQTIDLLHTAITDHGRAVWVLAGGTTPNLAYQIIADGYLDYIDWSNVTFVIGDERIGPLDGPDNNWQLIEELFLQYVPEATFLRPRSDLSAKDAAHDYEQQLATLPQADTYPRFDIVWLGMGEDGHTLSLFPDHLDFNPDDTHVVAPVHDSPKPPADRISLTLHALSGSRQTIILATGSAKRDAMIAATQPDSALPIAQAARATNTLWLTDITMR
ncbi:MAG: 6-phosphogluconolactonase [Candidatus Saccharimonadales bacterium]